jgi:hypothetical protein
MNAASIKNKLNEAIRSGAGKMYNFRGMEEVYNLTEDLAVALGVNDDPPMPKQERERRMKIANMWEEKRLIYNKALTELKEAAIRGDAVAQQTLKEVEFDKDVAMDNYMTLSDRDEKNKLYRRMIQKVQAEGGGKRTKSRKSKKSRKTRKHRK